MDSLARLLLAERFGAPPRLPVPALPGRLPSARGLAGPADVAERQRVLCEALDGDHLVVVTARDERGRWVA